MNVSFPSAAAAAAGGKKAPAAAKGAPVAEAPVMPVRGQQKSLTLGSRKGGVSCFHLSDYSLVHCDLLVLITPIFPSLRSRWGSPFPLPSRSPPSSSSLFLSLRQWSHWKSRPPLLGRQGRGPRPQPKLLRPVQWSRSPRRQVKTCRRSRLASPLPCPDLRPLPASVLLLELLA